MKRQIAWIPAVAWVLSWPFALPAGTPTTVPTTAPATQPQADDDNGTADEPKLTLDEPSIRSVVKLELKDRMLSMSTDLPLLEEAARIKIADFPGKTVAVVNNQHILPVITIRHEINLPPSTTIIYTLSSLPNVLQLSVDSENNNEVRTVQLIQNTSENTDMDEKPVKLYVSVSDAASGTKPVDLKLQADDVVQLRRLYPRETADYLQPLLAALGQEEVAFAVDHRTAWQVLHGHFIQDPAVADQVKQLVKTLDADDYGAREAAAESLDKLGEPAALVVMNMKRDGLSSEQNSRLDTFLAPYRPLSAADELKLSADTAFLLDCLYTDAQPMRRVAIEQLKQVTGKPIDAQLDASPAAWRTIVRQLRSQLLPVPNALAGAVTPTTAPATQP